MKGKETDITGVLVLILVVLVGVLVAKVSMDFTGKQTSTTTKAADDAQKYIPFCKQKVKEKLGDKYNTKEVLDQVTAKLYTTDCGNLNTRFAGGILVAGTGSNQTTDAGICCVAKSTLFVVNDRWCTLYTPRGRWPDGKTVEHIPAVCKDNSACTGSYGTINTQDYTVLWPEKKCDNVTNTKVESGKNFCCMMPLEQID